jgi:flagellar FliJ protein
MYKFTLEPVLNHRKIIEEELQKELADLKRRLVDEKRKLETYERAKSRSLAELQQKQEEGITAPEILLYESFIERLSRDLDKQKERVLGAEQKVDQKLEDLVAATKRRKTLDKLKEKGLEKYRRELLKNEQDFLNEVAVNRFNRRMNEE